LASSLLSFYPIVLHLAIVRQVLQNLRLNHLLNHNPKNYYEYLQASSFPAWMLTS